MQAAAGVPPELAQVLQALIVLFVAAPALVRSVFRVKAEGPAGTLQAKGWAG
jgi:simple sugar transport system permease protein